MDPLQTLYQQLSEQLNAHQKNNNSPIISAFHAKSALFDDFLPWLKAQNSYPQFYLHLRDGSQKWAAIGEVRSFFSTIHARDFVKQFNLPLLGGLTFDKQSYFFLPRILLIQQEDAVHAILFLDNQNDSEAEQQAAFNTLETLKKQTTLSELGQPAELVEQRADQTQWCKWVSQALSTIRSGELNKVVLANRTTFKTVNPLNAVDFLAESEKHNKGCYHFLFAQNAERTFLGSSPERLYARHGNRLETEALAGTALMNENSGQSQALGDWLLHDEKNVRENWLVAEGICHNLNQFANHIKIDELELKPLRQVQHLRRHISIELKSDCSDHDCLTAIHPTAAVSGLPQQAAIRFLQNTENFDRTWYAGTLGFMGPDSAEFCVTIRSAFIEQNKISIFAGAGIVEGSVPLLEWQEIERKATGLISLLNPKFENTEH